jgi:hypothetical protein
MGNPFHRRASSTLPRFRSDCQGSAPASVASRRALMPDEEGACQQHSVNPCLVREVEHQETAGRQPLWHRARPALESMAHACRGNDDLSGPRDADLAGSAESEMPTTLPTESC